MSRDLDEIRSLASPLIIYAGPELSRAAGLPTERELVARLLGEAEDYLSVRQHRELSGLAEGDEFGDIYGELERALSAANFGRIVERTLDDEDHAVPELAAAIAELGPRLRGVITPNLDLLLERAFTGQLVAHAKPTADIASRSGWLLKLRGTLHDRSTWILTTAQRGQALHRDPLHRELFRSLFFSHPILFVGTRLDDPLLSELISQVTALAQGQPPQHWALVNADEAGPITRRKFAAAGIRLIGYEDPQDDLSGCTAMVRALGSASAEPTAASASASSAPATASANSAQSSAPTTTPTTAPAATPTTTPAAAQTSASTSAAPGDEAMINVLFIAANPSGTDPLRIDRELRIIREAIERSRHRNRLDLDIRTAATVHDLRRAMLERDYGIVHLSGHGEQEGLLLEDERGECVEVPRAALARFFGRCAERSSLRCVLLNACWSKSIADAGMSVPFTVAMDGPISDVAALEYSRGFYDAVGAGMDIDACHDEGMMCVDLAAHGAKFECLLVRAT